MINSNYDEERHVVPRWRSMRGAIAAGEMNAPRKKSNKSGHCLSVVKAANDQIVTSFKKSKERWQHTGDLADAEELLTAALMTQKENDSEVLTAACDVARAPQVHGMMREFAEYIVGEKQADQVKTLPYRNVDVYAGIRERKRLLKLNPRDGLLVAETALLHANIGQQKKARKLLERALKTAPHNRYVLRAAVRFFCYAGDPEQALNIVCKSPRRYHDPWLRAAELATGAVLKKSPQDWRKAKELVNSGAFSDCSISELAVQMGTIELLSGSRRQALRILKKGIQSPTENAVAQVEHVGRKAAISELKKWSIDLSVSHEAAAHAAYWNSEWGSALSASEKWFEIEPFSTQSAIFGSGVASIEINSQNLKHGLALGLSALNINPSEPMLLNNVAVIHAYQGELKEAQSKLDQVKYDNNKNGEIINLATSGLILIRSEKINSGIQKYRDALDLALKNKKYVMALRVYCFLGRELSRGNRILAKSFGDNVDKIIENLKKAGYTIPKDVNAIRSQYDSLEIKCSGPLSELSLSEIPDLDFQI